MGNIDFLVLNESLFGSRCEKQGSPLSKRHGARFPNIKINFDMDN